MLAISATELALAADLPPLVEVAGTVDVDALARVPAVLVGVDVAPDVDVDRLAAAVDANPTAAITLAVLLRSAHRRTIDEGLVAESTAYATLQAGAEHQRWLATTPRPSHHGERSPVVRVERDGQHLHITLDRPSARNALDAALRDELTAALTIAAAEPTLQITIEGAGSTFCSGGDLSEFGTTPDPATAHLTRLRRSPAALLAAVGDRTAVTVHGSCVGAGVELAAFASVVRARPDATFRLPEVGMGLVPGAGGTVSLPRRIGRQRTAWLAISGEVIDATTAHDWGLVDELM